MFRIQQQMIEIATKPLVHMMKHLLIRSSNYWTAALYFHARNGTFKRVQQYANLGLVQRGGMTVYYIPPYDGFSKVTAFKPVREQHHIFVFTY
jgi:hypothetical protein